MRRRMTWAIVILVACFLFLGLGGCSGLANQLILHPSHQPIPSSAKRQTLRVEQPPLGGREVEFFTSDLGDGDGEPDFYVLAFTGNAGRAETLPEIVAAQFGPWLSRHRGARIGVVSMQYPGYGSDQEAASLSGNIAAAQALCAAVRERAGGKPIVAYGVSLGTIFALNLAATLGPSPAGPDALILEKPPNVRSFILWRHGWWNLWLVAVPVAFGVPAGACSDSLAEKVRATPALFLIAVDDEVVPKVYAEAVAEAYAAPKQVVATQGGHQTLASQYPGPEFMAGMAWLLDPLVAAAKRATPAK